MDPKENPPPLPPLTPVRVPRRARSDYIFGGIAAGIAAGAVFSFGYALLLTKRSSQDKAVRGQLQQLAAAADQYFLENGVTTVAYGNVVGATTYLKAIYPVAGETYPTFYTHGHPLTASGVRGARTITYMP